MLGVFIFDIGVKFLQKNMTQGKASDIFKI